MEMEEVVKILIVVVVLIILIGAVIFLFKGKGGELLESVKNVLRLGR
ncbi:MAG: hypothetical protein Q8N88_02345 [Nanoarchaeota archaeon]|nr:hypothetical protein [Nanoarchaeota archaeon]